MGSLSIETKEVDGPQAITPSAEELAKGAFSSLSLTRVLEALHQDGLVVLRNVVDLEHVDTLNEKMCKDADERIADPTQEFNHSVACMSVLGRRQQAYADVFRSELFAAPAHHRAPVPVQGRVL